MIVSESAPIWSKQSKAIANLVNGEREKRDADRGEEHGGDGEADGRGPGERHGREQPPPPGPEPPAVLPLLPSLRAVRPAPRPPPRPQPHRSACQICPQICPAPSSPPPPASPPPPPPTPSRTGKSSNTWRARRGAGSGARVPRVAWRVGLDFSSPFSRWGEEERRKRERDRERRGFSRRARWLGLARAYASACVRLHLPLRRRRVPATDKMSRVCRDDASEDGDLCGPNRGGNFTWAGLYWADNIGPSFLNGPIVMATYRTELYIC